MKLKFIYKLIIAVFVCLAIGFIGSIATQTSVNTWYLTLNKPVFNPPNWLFAPVWTALYILMGISAALVWHRGFHHVWVKTALYHFGFQLLLNALWSIVFFGLQKPLLALFVIVALFILILLTFKWFKVVSSKASYLIIPYLVWVAFAMLLNFEIWRLN